ncbi:hypothetical protein A9Q99_05025 [Gammaproteobacteria bacterium 45_16_T64]|nr:hypothetical protein A9Q99_05025 [Gammaproteobacteria bacterium 45_16_T64]
MRVMFVIILLAVSGCTSIKVNQVDASHNITHVCIENNPKVLVKEFVPVIVNAMSNHFITTERYYAETPSHCKFRLTYTARRSWDLSPYLSHAQLKLFDKNRQIGFAQYHLIGGGGFDFSKWNSVESKMVPVVDRLLKQY